MQRKLAACLAAGRQHARHHPLALPWAYSWPIYPTTATLPPNWAESLGPTPPPRPRAPPLGPLLGDRGPPITRTTATTRQVAVARARGGGGDGDGEHGVVKAFKHCLHRIDGCIMYYYHSDYNLIIRLCTSSID